MQKCIVPNQIPSIYWKERILRKIENPCFLSELSSQSYHKGVSLIILKPNQTSPYLAILSWDLPLYGLPFSTEKTPDLLGPRTILVSLNVPQIHHFLAMSLFVSDKHPPSFCLPRIFTLRRLWLKSCPKVKICRKRGNCTPSWLAQRWVGANHWQSVPNVTQKVSKKHPNTIQNPSQKALARKYLTIKLKPAENMKTTCEQKKTYLFLKTTLWNRNYQVSKLWLKLYPKFSTRKVLSAALLICKDWLKWYPKVRLLGSGSASIWDVFVFRDRTT